MSFGVCLHCEGEIARDRGTYSLSDSEIAKRKYCSSRCARLALYDKHQKNMREVQAKHLLECRDRRFGGDRKVRFECFACGKSCMRYRATNGKMPKYCSTDCANKTNKTVSTLRERFQWEHAAVDILEKDGYVVGMPLGSRGPADVVGFRDCGGIAVQVKSSTNPRVASNVSAYVKAVQRLQSMWIQDNFVKELWILLLDRNEWKRIDIRSLGVNKKEIRYNLKQWIEKF